MMLHAGLPTFHVRLFLWIDSVADGSIHFANKWLAGEIHASARLLMASFCTVAPGRAMYCIDLLTALNEKPEYY